MRSKRTAGPVTDSGLTACISPLKRTTVASFRTVDASTCTVACSRTIFTKYLSNVPFTGKVEEAGVGVCAKIPAAKKQVRSIENRLRMGFLCLEGKLLTPEECPKIFGSILRMFSQCNRKLRKTTWKHRNSLLQCTLR